MIHRLLAIIIAFAHPKRRPTVFNNPTFLSLSVLRHPGKQESEQEHRGDNEMRLMAIFPPWAHCMPWAHEGTVHNSLAPDPFYMIFYMKQ